MTAANAIATVPALPLHTAGKYVAGAYIVLFVLVLIYVAIMAIRLSRIESELGELLSMSEQTPPDVARSSDERDYARGTGAQPQETDAQELTGEPRESAPA